jgi:hypothetical protein
MVDVNNKMQRLLKKLTALHIFKSPHTAHVCVSRERILGIFNIFV